MGIVLIFLSINLVKLQNTPKIGGLTIIKSLFSREIETTKVPNLFDHHHILFQDTNMLKKIIVIFFEFISISMC